MILSLVNSVHCVSLAKTTLPLFLGFRFVFGLHLYLLEIDSRSFMIGTCSSAIYCNSLYSSFELLLSVNTSCILLAYVMNTSLLHWLVKSDGCICCRFLNNDANRKILRHYIYDSSFFFPENKISVCIPTLPLTLPLNQYNQMKRELPKKLSCKLHFNKCAGVMYCVMAFIHVHFESHLEQVGRVGKSFSF